MRPFQNRLITSALWGQSPQAEPVADRRVEPVDEAVPDRTYGGTPLDQCLYGSLHGWHCATGDFPTTLRLLLEAGERPDRRSSRVARDDVDEVLRTQLAGDA